MNDTLAEASAVREDLAELLESSVEISQLIIDNLDDRIEVINNLDNSIREADEKQQKLEQTINNLDSLLPVNPALEIEAEESCSKDDSVNVEQSKPLDLFIGLDPVRSEIIQPARRHLKVYELARELDMSSKSLIKVLNDMGYKVSHHMKMLDENVVQRVIEKILPESVNTDSRVQHLSLVSRTAIHNVGKTVHNKAASEITMDFSIDELKKAHPYLAVHTLYEKGFSIRDIAKMLDRGQGEVSLILNLSRKKQACS